MKWNEWAWRSTDAIMINAPTRHYYLLVLATTAAWPRKALCEYAPYARQASTKRRESNGCDVQWRRSQPQMAPDWGFAN